jgi:hypothetical protein
MTEKMSPEVFQKLEETVLNILNESAGLLALWMFNHPDAKNYCLISFLDENKTLGDFDIIIQKHTQRKASCPLCHGTASATEHEETEEK